jgi:hypothetical protein
MPNTQIRSGDMFETGFCCSVRSPSASVPLGTLSRDSVQSEGMKASVGHLLPERYRDRPPCRTLVHVPGGMVDGVRCILQLHRGLGGLPMCGTFDVSTTYNRVEFEVHFPDPLASNSTNHQHQNGSYPLPYPGTPVRKILRRPRGRSNVATMRAPDANRDQYTSPEMLTMAMVAPMFPNDLTEG